jgi:hypothetical protein
VPETLNMHWQFPNDMQPDWYAGSNGHVQLFGAIDAAVYTLSTNLSAKVSRVGDTMTGNLYMERRLHFTAPGEPVYDLWDGSSGAHIYWKFDKNYNVPDGKVLYMMYMAGEMKGSQTVAKQYHGLVMEIVNGTNGGVASETTSCWALQAICMTKGPGPGNGAYIEAKSSTEEGGGGKICAAWFQIHPDALTNADSACIRLNRFGPSGIGPGIQFMSLEGAWPIGIDFVTKAPQFTGPALWMQCGQTPGATIKWGGGPSLFSWAFEDLTHQGALGQHKWFVLRGPEVGSYEFGLRTEVFRGSTVAATVGNGDMLFTHKITGFDGTNFITAAQISTTVNGPVSAGVVPGRMDFYTQSPAGAVAPRLTITDHVAVGGALELSNAAADPSVAGYLQRNNNALAYNYGLAAGRVPLQLYSLPVYTGTPANTAETNLGVYNLLANTLISGRAIEFYGTFYTVNNGNTKTMRVYWGSQLVFNRTTTFPNEVLAFRILVRHDPTPGQHITVLSINPVTGPAIGFVNGTQAVNADILIRATGQNGVAAGADIMLVDFGVKMAW